MRKLLKSILILSTLGSSYSYTKELPTWEVNAGMVAIQIPHYRGSKNYTRFVAPFPVLKYRSKYFNIDEGKVQGLLYASKIFEFDVSVAGSLPASSDKSSVRSGMPTLDTTFEVGPSFLAHLWKSSDESSKIWFEFPLRAAASVNLDDISIKNHGFISSPSINYKLYADNRYFNLRLSLSSIYATSQYHNYFYGVSDRYKTLTRPSYSTSGGYSGNSMILKTDKKIKKWTFEFFARYDTFSNAVFIDSPLVEQHDSLSLGFVVVREIAKSKKFYKRD